MGAGRSEALVSVVRLARERITSPDEYPFCLPALRGMDTLALHPRVTFLVGENGSRKSTLLEAIAVAMGINPEGGSKNFSFSTRPSHSTLGDYLRVGRTHRRMHDSYFLRAESYFNVASEIEQLDALDVNSRRIIESYGGKSLHEQSHGESFFALLRHRLRGDGMYLFDEPEAALSPMRQLAALKVIHDLASQGSQFVIATHSPILLAYPDAWIYILGEQGMTRTPYDQLEHVRVTRDFLNHPERSLRVLLRDEP